jgi:hypothetical protein
MGTLQETVPVTYANGSYCAETYWYSGSDETTESWAAAVNNAGTGTLGTFSGEVSFFFNTRDGSPPATPPDGVWEIFRTDLVYDLRHLGLLPQISSATITFWTNGNSDTDGNLWPTDNAGGIALFGQRDSVRGTGKSAANHYEIYYWSASNPGVELANRIPWSNLTYTGSNFQRTFTLNSTGLAYLNSVWSNTYNPGWLFLGIDFGGVVDGVNPTLPSGEWGWQKAIRTLTQPVLTLNWDSGDSMRINIGDSWKDVVGIQINRDGANWDQVLDLDINIADSWKDKV